MDSIKKFPDGNRAILGIILIFLVIATSNISFNLQSFLDHKYGKKLNIEDLKISTTSGKIFLNGSSDWLDFKNSGNCTGQGTYSDPYVIEDLVINGGFTGSGISIANSEVYFKIENCTIFNAGIVGIYFYNVSNGHLLNNTCSNCFGEGLRLDLSHNNSISEMNVHDNFDGIRIYESNNNNISGNQISNNDYAGIGTTNSNNTKIIGNLIDQNRIGIELWKSNNSFISGNIMNECGLRIFGNIESFTSNEVETTNIVNTKPLYYYTNELGLTSNNFTNGGQVILINCNDSSITDLDVSDSTRGISLYYCTKNNISGNIANNNLYGISLEYSNDVTISGNTANNNFWNGIDLVWSNNNTIKGNTANRNSVGLGLWTSNNTLVSGNTANTNLYYGIWLDESNNNTITGNTASSNTIGILLEGSNNNEVTGNSLIGNDECINEFNSEGNSLENNTCGETSVIIGYDLLYLLGAIFLISIIFLKRFKIAQKL